MRLQRSVEVETIEIECYEWECEMSDGEEDEEPAPEQKMTEKVAEQEERKNKRRVEALEAHDDLWVPALNHASITSGLAVAMPLWCDKLP